MSDPFIGEIKLFAGNFAPVNYALCNGQLLSIAQNQALFTLLGTAYGGNGVQTFGLPNFQGRFPVNQGQAPGLSNYVMGQAAGTENVTLLSSQIPTHTHQATANSDATNPVNSPANNVWSASATPNFVTYTGVTPAPPLVAMNPSAVSIVGGNVGHNNMPPYLAVSFIIALYGIFPSRN